jgi:hypothetical protein
MSLQAPLLTAQPSATAFGLLRSIKRTTIAATAVVAPTAVVVAPAALVGSGESIWRWSSKIAALARRPRAIFGDIQAQFAPTDFAPVEFLDRLSRVLFSCKSDECEAPGASTFAVLWNVNVNYLADLSEELTKLFVGRAKVEVPYEYLT